MEKIKRLNANDVKNLVEGTINEVKVCKRIKIVSGEDSLKLDRKSVV